MRLGLFLFFILGSWTAQALDHTHSEWTLILKQYLSFKNGSRRVDYAKLKENPLKLRNYLQSLSDVRLQDYTEFSREQKMAFLINAYNSFAVDIIVRRFPIRSLQEIGTAFSPMLKSKFFKLWGDEMSLDVLQEHLRQDFKDPRVYFALSCGAVSCPRLLDEAYVPDRLDDQLEKQTRIFIQDPQQNMMEYKKRKYKLSKIFLWHKEDFEQGGSSLQKFVGRYISNDESVTKYLKDGNLSVEFQDKFDWNLTGI